MDKEALDIGIGALVNIQVVQAFHTSGVLVPDSDAVRLHSADGG